MKNLRMEGNVGIRELRMLRDWAYIRNSLEMKITPEGGESVKRSGCTVAIVRKESDQSRLARDANLIV
jgi:ketosteroid isomerase-like protein